MNMAYSAYSKKDNIMVSLEDWQLQRIEEIPYCPVCEGIINIRAKGSIAVNTHFKHESESGCPTIERNRRKYELLPPQDRDISNGNALKNWVKVNAHHLYLKCKEVSGFLKMPEFEKMLLKANENKIWYYKGLTTQHLPYVLLINYGMFDKIENRAEKMYFIFEKDVQGDDMFLKREITKIWRIKPENDVIEEVHIDYNIQGTAKHYFWTYVKKFV